MPDRSNKQDEHHSGEGQPKPALPSATLDEVLDDAGSRTGGSLSFEAAVRILRHNRARH